VVLMLPNVCRIAWRSFTQPAEQSVDARGVVEGRQSQTEVKIKQVEKQNGELEPRSAENLSLFLTFV
jgi:hypothetical protein